MFHTPAHKHVGPNPPAQVQYTPLPVDFKLVHHGDNFTLTPLTADAAHWCADFVWTAKRWGQAYVIPDEIIEEIVDAALELGYTFCGTRQ
jgi:hypothetical protein